MTITQTKTPLDITQIKTPKGNILVVDDIPENLHLLSDTLTEQGYDVRGVINGSMALRVAHSVLPDLILLDIKMPDMNGYEVCQRLKASESTRPIPVIFLSALNEVIDKVKAFEVGGVDYISKPFQVQEVLARVENQLTIQRLQKQLWAKNLALETANQELERSNRELEQFAHVLCHDLNQPLQSIILHTDMLDINYQDRLDMKGEGYIRKIRDSSLRMKTFMQDLLVYAKVGADSQEITSTDCNIVLEQVLDNLKAAISEKNALITHDSLPTVNVSQTQLIQLFQNLISNAIKFQAPGTSPQVKVSVKPVDNSRDTDHGILAEVGRVSSINATEFEENGRNSLEHGGNYWLFGVHDNGIGMEPDQRSHIFEIFQRLHSNQDYPGTGIGLATCKKIVENHGGQIGVESEPGVGSTFYFTLPAQH
ncbi:response regulator [Moorena sp. SIO4G3]|uniref:response regulator n=1 Tax=Moorena sp. SIO4G3 TaxID=2607821 RepID=UPI00142ADDE8|nr:response regulator [Moorena sp. SIO4G3]NEO78111.1 response regulator [Moorena sp. SIO4G3]